MATQNNSFLSQDDMEKYKYMYSDEKLMAKLGKFAKKAGLDTVYYVLLLYNVLLSGKMKDILIVTAALGYFISPIDLIPDLLVGVGFVDDATILLGALAGISTSITPAIKSAAKAQLRKWFNFDDSELNEKYR